MSENRKPVTTLNNQDSEQNPSPQVPSDKPEVSVFIENLLKSKEGRRGFLKGFLKVAGIASISLPALLEAAWCDYQNHQNYGNHYNYTDHSNTTTWTNTGGWTNYGNHSNGSQHVNCQDQHVAERCHFNYIAPPCCERPQWCDATCGWCNIRIGGFHQNQCHKDHLDHSGWANWANRYCDRPDIMNRLPLPGCGRWYNGGIGKGGWSNYANSGCNNGGECWTDGAYWDNYTEGPWGDYGNHTNHSNHSNNNVWTNQGGWIDTTA